MSKTLSCHPEARALCGPKDLWTRRQCGADVVRTLLSDAFDSPSTRVAHRDNIDPTAHGRYEGARFAGCESRGTESTEARRRKASAGRAKQNYRVRGPRGP